MRLRNKISRARKAGLRIVEVGRDVPRDEANVLGSPRREPRMASREGQGARVHDRGDRQSRGSDAPHLIAVDPFDKTVGFHHIRPGLGAGRRAISMT